MAKCRKDFGSNYKYLLHYSLKGQQIFHSFIVNKYLFLNFNIIFKIIFLNTRPVFNNIKKYDTICA